MISAKVGPARIAAVALDSDGQAHLHCFTCNGKLQWSKLLRQERLVPVPSWDWRKTPIGLLPWPTIVAVDETSVLMLAGSQLSAYNLGGGSTRWRLSLETSFKKFTPRIIDWLQANPTLDDHWRRPPALFSLAGIDPRNVSEHAGTVEVSTSRSFSRRCGVRIALSASQRPIGSS